MDLPPFRLNEWVVSRQFATPIRYDLASSSGPAWTVGELFALGGGIPNLDKTALKYGPPAGQRALRGAIAEFHDVDPDWVVVTTGASEAMSIILCLASRPGANVVFPEPVYTAFEAMALAWRYGTRRYPLARDNSYRVMASDVRRAVDDDTVLALVNTPHNPTGAVVPRGEIAALASELAGAGVPLIVDEVYHPVYFGTPAQSAAQLGNVIVIGDMSKAFSLPGIRVGWLIDANAGRRKRLIDARSHFSISNSPLAEAIAAHALIHRDAILARVNRVAKANLELLSAFMSEASDVLAWVKPGGGTSAFPWFRDGRNSRALCERLASEGVLVAPGDCFNMPEHMRVGFGAQAEGFPDALAIFRHTLQR